MESPAGVGYSYSTEPKVDYAIDDNQTAYDNYGTLVSFFQAFPEYKENDFFMGWGFFHELYAVRCMMFFFSIRGESYGGIYIPTLANLIRMMNKDQKNIINLKGFMVSEMTTGGNCYWSKLIGCLYVARWLVQVGSLFAI